MLCGQGEYRRSAGNPGKISPQANCISSRGKERAGEWALVRLQRGGDRDWLVLKIGENAKPVSKKKDDESALSGRTMAGIAREAESGMELESGKSGSALKLRAADESDAGGGGLRVARSGSYELKFDGIIGRWRSSPAGGPASSRNAKDFSGRFPKSRRRWRRLPPGTASSMRDRGRFG